MKMKKRRRYGRRKCRCCRRWFVPQPHNAYHQRYCTQRGCRLASRRASQRRYNRTHPLRYGGHADVLRMRMWRDEHPYYWRRVRYRQILLVELTREEDAPHHRR